MRQPLAERARDSLRLRALDARDRLRGRSDRLVPPRRLGFAGHADFAEAGDALVSIARAFADLEPDVAVLEAGCGAGRVARPLSTFLSASGTYEGFDVDREAIGWCRRRYARHANFRFQVADVFDRRRNPRGAHAPGDYRFPYEDGHFDVVLVPELMTRLLESEADHLLAESARVVRPAGFVVAGLFVLDDESRPRIADGTAGLPFLDPEGHVAMLSEDVPEEAVAYDGGWLAERFTAHGLAVRKTARGTWCDDAGATFTDVVVLHRVPA